MPYDFADAKRRNENASVILLHRHLVSAGVSLGAPRAGDPSKHEPDGVCETADGPRGIEATNVFYDEAVASWTWGIAIEAEGGKAPRRVRGEPFVIRGQVVGELSPLLVNAHLTLADAAQTQLEQKCGKSYVMPTYLVLDARTAGIVTAEDWPQMADRLRLPVGCPFLGAYLCLSENMTGIPRIFEIARS